MSLVDLKIHIPANIQLFCWELSPNDKKVLENAALEFALSPDNFKLESLWHQELIKALLIREAFGSVRTVETYTSGKPKPIDDCSISFSHSDGLIILAVAERNVGIDVQYYTDKLIRVSGKFVSDQEESFLAIDVSERNRQIHFMWCAKEAVFKLYGKNMPFKDIVAQNLRLEDSGVIHFQVGERQHPVHYSFFNQYCFCLTQ